VLANRLRAWRLFAVAQRYHERGASRKAAALYQRVVRLDPAARGARLWRGVALAELGKFDEAGDAVRGARAGPLFEARVLYDAGRLEEARAAVALASRDNAQARGLLALCLLRLGGDEEAGQILRGDIPFAPWLLGRLLLAVEERHQGRVEAPAEPVGSAEIPPAARGASTRQLRRGLVALRNERWEKARDAFARAPAEDPRTLYGLGTSLYFLNHFAPARGYLLGAIDRLEDPFQSEAQATLGKIALELGDAGEAVLRLRRAIAGGAAEPDNYYALGLAYRRRGRPDLARRAFEKCASPEFVRERWNELVER